MAQWRRSRLAPVCEESRCVTPLIFPKNFVVIIILVIWFGESRFGNSVRKSRYGNHGIKELAKKVHVDVSVHTYHLINGIFLFELSFFGGGRRCELMHVQLRLVLIQLLLHKKNIVCTEYSVFSCENLSYSKTWLVMDSYINGCVSVCEKSEKFKKQNE